MIKNVVFGSTGKLFGLAVVLKLKRKYLSVGGGDYVSQRGKRTRGESAQYARFGDIFKFL